MLTHETDAIPHSIETDENQDAYAAIKDNNHTASSFESNPQFKGKLEELVGQLKSNDALDSIFAADELAQIGEPAVSALIEVLQDRTNSSRYPVATALGDIGADAQPAIPALVKAAKDPDPELRLGAVEALGKIGYQPQVTLPTLRAALNDEENKCQVAAAIAILTFTPDDQEASRRLIKALSDPDSGIRSDAVQALEAHRAIAIKAISDLIAAINDKHPNVRKYAIATLGNLGSGAKLAVDPLVAVLNDPDVFIRTTAIESLGNIGPTASDAIPALTAILSQTDALPNPEQQAVVDRAAKVLNMQPSGDINISVGTAIALDKIDHKNPAARAILTGTMNDKNQPFWYRLEAVEYLASVGENERLAVDVLVQHVEHPDERARMQAGYALARIGRTEAIPVLIKALKFDNQLRRLEAADALGNLGRSAKPAVRALLDASKSPYDQALRKRAVIALDKIQTR